jgi:GTPase Era involved in 16S rRNA processing
MAEVSLPLLEVRGLTKSFFGVTVLHGVDFSVQAGKALGLVGENGSGKSTSMNILGGVHQPDRGTMRLNGEAYAPAQPKDATAAGVAFIHQELNLFTNLTIEENLFVDAFPRRRLLPFIESLRSQAAFEFVVPLSAERGENCDALLAELHSRLPKGPLLYPEDQVTDRSMRFVVTEVVREKLMLRLREEIPYGLTVEVEAYEDGSERTDIAAVIWVARESHKGIVIGKGGAMLRDVGTAARRDLEAMLERKVFLRLHVKVREDWVDDEQALRRFGYE